ncbi:MAG: DUF485 domain-containing protein [Alphaproteobacteria bacterium]|nr:MAG: DUF485 domain-containing protein [Alphaproteobacteria bacterium]
MSPRNELELGPADATIASKEDAQWTLVLVRDLRHSPDKVWDALTDPAQLKEWAPFDADRNLGSVGFAQLTTVGAPEGTPSESKVERAEPPHLLEYQWGAGGTVRWELEATSNGTRLSLWASIDRRFVAMGAFAPAVLAKPVLSGGTVNWAFAYGLFVIVLGVVLTGIYVLTVNRADARLSGK